MYINGNVFEKESQIKKTNWLQVLFDNYCEKIKELIVRKPDGSIDEIKTRLLKRRYELRTIDAVKGYVKGICGDSIGYITDEESRRLLFGEYFFARDTGKEGVRHLNDDEILEALKELRENDIYSISKPLNNNCFMDDLKKRYNDEFFYINDQCKTGNISVEDAKEEIEESKKEAIINTKSHIEKLFNYQKVTDEETNVIFDGDINQPTYRNFKDDEIVLIINNLRATKQK